MAKVILNSGEERQIRNSGDEVFGTNGIDAVTIEGSVYSTKFDQNIERVAFEGVLSDYTFLQAGNNLKVYSGSTVVATIIVQADGTQLTFANGTVDATFNTSGATPVIKLGGASVSSTVASLPAVSSSAIDTDLVTDIDAASNVFTLQEAYTQKTVVTESAYTDDPEVYWGYNPHPHDETSGVDNLDGDNPDGNDNNLTNEGPQDGGVPVQYLYDYLELVAGLDFVQLGLINIANGDTNGESKQVSADIKNIDIVNNDDGTQTITVTLNDGTVNTAEVALGEMYFKLVRDALFDQEGNSRLFEVAGEYHAAETSVVKTQVPIKLTEAINNGGTVETGFTTDGDDLIQVGRLDLLHQAYINAGGGYNTLEIDAKGYYAQPLALLNIQKISIENLPNVYTNVEDGAPVSTYPDLDSDGYFTSLTNSVIDLSRAVDLERLVITEGSFEGLDLGHPENPGSLTVAGIRNGAVARFEGAFTQDVTLHYGEGLTGPLTVELLIGQITGALNFAHNTDALHLVSLGGSANSFGTEDLGGRLTNLIISGDAALYINGDLDSSFQDETPITIDASANTGGVNLELSGSQNVTFLGSQADDIFKVDTEEDGYFNYNNSSVTIVGNGGNNLYQIDEAYRVDITDQDGNNNYEVADAIIVNITAGNGDNHFEIDDVQQATLVATGNGNNKFEVYAWNTSDTAYPDESLDVPAAISIKALGTGHNDIDVEANFDIGVVNVQVGNGGNTVDVIAHEVNITSGTTADVIKVVADKAVINSGGGGDTITVGGFDYDYTGTDELGGNGTPSSSGEWGDDGILMQINTGSGVATVILGSERGYESDQDNDFPGVSSLTAKEGSSISAGTGGEVILFVNTVADLRAATLSNIKKVVLDDDSFDFSDAPLANEAIGGVNAAVLTLTSTQFKDLAGKFSVDGAVFNTHAFIKIIVDETTTLSDLGVASLPRNIDLLLEVQDGVTLTMTAQQLHTLVAQNGVTLANDGNTDYANGKVVITGGGLNFDPFNTSDTVQSVINGTTYYGGSLSSDFQNGSTWYNVTVKSLVNGWDRPADAAAEVVLTLDSTGDATLTQGAFSTWHHNLEIVGDQDIVFTGALSLGLQSGVPTTPFDIDFSALEGTATNLTIDNFELLGQGGSIKGNADAGYASEVLIQIAADDDDSSAYTSPNASTVGFDETDAQSLVSQGVSRYVVTVIDGYTAPESDGSTATIKLCDTAQDIEVFALRGNYNDTLNIENAAWGLKFELQGGGTAKSEGPTGTANVGALVANYEWDHAVADVTLTHSVAGDTRPIHAAGIDIDNADTINIDVDASAATIESVDGNSVTVLDVNADGNVTIVNELPTALTEFDAAGVAGTLSVTVDLWEANDTPLTFIGAEGSTTLTIDDAADDAIASISGAGEITLVIGDGDGSDSVDLSGTDLTNITKVIFADDATLTITMADADVIGADNFVFADGADSADLNLVGLNGEEFALANYPTGVTITLTLANDPVVHLHDDTVLTGIAGLVVPEGTVLELTAAQFQQLTDDGTITGLGSVHIYDLHQSDVGAAGADFDLDNVNVGGTVTITLAESVDPVDLSDADLVRLGNPNVDVFNVGDNMTLVLGSIDDADGVSVVGGENSTLQFTDTSDLLGIDASGFDVDFLKVLNVLVDDINIDWLFRGLTERVTKVIYNDLGWVQGVTQNITVLEGTTIPGDLEAWNVNQQIEIQQLNLKLDGGVHIDGDVEIPAIAPFFVDDELIRTYLKTMNIVSTGTAANLLNGETANVIDGDIDPTGGFLVGDNNLLTVNITADQDLIIEGDVIFSSVVGDDDITANDFYDAEATLNVTGQEDVTIGGLDTDDNEVDSLVINHVGTGALTVGIDGDDTDDGDVITFNGDAVGIDTIIVSNDLNLADGDDLNDVDAILLNQGADLTLTMQQYLDLASIIGLNNGATAATISLVGLEDGDVFVATALPAGITVGSITLAPGTVTIGPGSDLTDVGSIIIPEGGTLNISAANYAELLGNGTITILDTDGNPGNDAATVNITGLTQAIVDEDGFNIVDIAAGIDVTVTLGEDRVNLGTYDDDGNLTYAANLDSTGPGNPPDATFILADGQTLGVVNNSQADGLIVESDSPLADTTLVWMFDSVPFGPFAVIDASGYSVSTLKTLNVLVNGTNVESMISELDSDVTLQIYHNTEDLGWLNPTYRVVVVEEAVTVNGSVMFNDPDSDDEVLTLNLTMLGGAMIDGDVLLSTTDSKDEAPLYFQSLIINSENENNTENYEQAQGGNTGVTANIITGDIDADWDGGLPGVPPFPKEENNLLNITINATEDLEIQGRVALDSVDADADAFLTVSSTSTADVTIGQIDILDEEVASLTIANNGTGILTITGGSPAIIADAGESFETLTLKGTGDIVIGDNDLLSSETGIDAPTLSEIDASELSGDLALGEVEDIDSDDFTFTSGTGVTTMTLTDDMNAGGDWSFDFTGADPGSQLELNGVTVTTGDLSIELGADATLLISSNMDLSALDSFYITPGEPIYLAQGVTLSLTAAQANDLTILLAPGATAATVNVVDLGDAQVDLSGIDIASGITGIATLEDNDVTLHADTDLGAFSIYLYDVADNTVLAAADELQGQTIRFQTVEQAERPILVEANDGLGSTNVVWLFDSVTGPVNTDDYAPGLDRLWFYQGLVDGENVEQLFTSLPNAILRMEVTTLAALAAPLDESLGVNRVIELVAFSEAPLGLTFSDEDRLEHIESLTVNMGGEVTVGPIEIDNLVNPVAGVDLSSIVFNELTINSYLADDTGDLLASEIFVEELHVKPTAANIVGDISVGSNVPGLDLLTVNLDTHTALTGNNGAVDSAINVLTGNVLEVGTITFDSAVADDANLNVTGANDIDIEAVIASDPDIDALIVDATGFTATLTAPGASPAIQMGTAETLTFTNGNVAAGTITLGTATNAGVIGSEISLIDADDFDGTLNLGRLAQLDSTNDDSSPGTPANDGLLPAFTFDSGAGVTTATIGATTGVNNTFTPTLNTDSEWVFNYSDVLPANRAASSLTIDSSAVFQAGAILTMLDVPVVINGTVDLSQVVLNLNAGTTIWVPAGQTLILTVDQLQEADMVDIEGAGTLKVVGDASNLVGTAYTDHILTVGVDISALTLIASPTVGFDTDDTLELNLGDANSGSPAVPVVAGHVVTGSANDDHIILDNPPATQGSTVTGGAGDDTIDSYGLGSSTTFIVDAGTDTINGMWTNVPTNTIQDVLVVNTGATAIATLVDTSSFVATAATINNGTATIQNGNFFGGGANQTIDMSLALGNNGFTIIGGESDATGAHTLIGSGKADIINGGNLHQTAAAAIDTLTGNLGADVFAFNLDLGTAATLTPATTTAAIDRELITFTADGADGNNESIAIDFDVNSTNFNVNVNLVAVDVTDQNAVASAIQQALDPYAGVVATVLDNVVTLTGVDGNAITINLITNNNFDALTGGVATNGTDVAQITTLTISGTPSVGDFYSVSTELLLDATGAQGSYTAVGGDGTDQIATGLSTGLFGYVSADISDVAVGSVITFTALDGDLGGFSLAHDKTAAFAGSGASAIVTNAVADLATSDLITDFMTGVDKIDFGLQAGSGTNYVGFAQVADYATAWANANTAFNNTVQYYLTSLADDPTTAAADQIGLLFFDANLDGNVDGVVRLAGVSVGTFAAADIIA